MKMKPSFAPSVFLSTALLGFAVLTSGCPVKPAADVQVSDLYLAGSPENGVIGYSFDDGASSSAVRVRGTTVPTDATSYISFDIAGSEKVSGLLTAQGKLWLLTRNATAKTVTTHVWGDPHVDSSRKELLVADGAQSGALAADGSTKVHVVVDGRGLTPDEQDLIFSDDNNQSPTSISLAGTANQTYLRAYAPNDDTTVYASTARTTDCDDNDPKRHHPTACLTGSVQVHSITGATISKGTFDGAPMAVWTDGKTFSVLSIRPDSTVALTSSSGGVDGPVVPQDACTSMTFSPDGTGYVLIVTQDQVRRLTITRQAGVGSSIVEARNPSLNPITYGQCAIRVKPTQATAGTPSTLAAQVAWVEDGDEAPASAIVVSVTEASTGELMLKNKHDTVKNSINNVR